MPTAGPPGRLPAEFKDHFSRDAAAYAEYRPRYPDELFVWLAAQAPSRRLAWDAGTGNGQAAVALAEYFSRVVATDPSEEQLAEAPARPKLEYRQAAEEAALPDASVDLVTVAQALHWFDRPRFWAEARRVLRPRGVIAVWCYQPQRVSPEIDRLIHRFYHDTVGPWWPPDRKLVEQGYRTIEFPFREITPPEFSMSAEWTLEQQLGYVGTWSAVSRMREATGQDPVGELRPELDQAWGDGRRLVVWPLSVRAGLRT
jgi:SAM-dependent methyltransferase